MKKNRKAWFFNGLYIVTVTENGLVDDLVKNEEKYTIEGNKIYVTIGDDFGDTSFGNVFKQINYPTSINCYYNDSLPFYDEQTGWGRHVTLATLINTILEKKEETNIEHYFFDCIPETYDYEFMTKRFDEKGVKGYFGLQLELADMLFLIDGKERPFFFINEVLLTEFTRKKCTVNYYSKSRVLIEKRIRDKNYFLSKYSKEVIDKIVEAILLETISSDKKKDCIIQDTLIHLEDSDYSDFEKEISDEMFESINEFLEKHKDGFIVDFIFGDKANSIFKNVLKKINFDQKKFLDLIRIMDIFLDYRKLNYNLSKLLYKNSGKKYGFKIMTTDENFIKKNAYLKNVEKTEYRNRLKRIIERLKAIELFYGKEEYLK